MQALARKVQNVGCWIRNWFKSGPGWNRTITECFVTQEWDEANDDVETWQARLAGISVAANMMPWETKATMSIQDELEAAYISDPDHVEGQLVEAKRRLWAVSRRLLPKIQEADGSITVRRDNLVFCYLADKRGMVTRKAKTYASWVNHNCRPCWRSKRSLVRSARKTFAYLRDIGQPASEFSYQMSPPSGRYLFPDKEKALAAVAHLKRIGDWGVQVSRVEPPESLDFEEIWVVRVGFRL